MSAPFNELIAREPLAGAAKMGNVTVKIPHITWRGGRPRFEPGPSMRRLGFTGADLRHADGTWFIFDETIERSAIIVEQAKAARKGARKGAPRAPRARPKRNRFAVGDLVAQVFALPIFHQKEDHSGRRHRKALKPATVKDYHASSRIVINDHPNIWAAPPGDITPNIASVMIERVEQARGLAQARKVRSLMSMVYKRSRQAYNPFSGIELPELVSTPKDITPEHMAHLVQCFDAAGRPEIGDMVYLGIYTAQRQKDRFELVAGHMADGRMVITQNKTSTIISLDPQLMQPLIARLDQARQRRAEMKVAWPQLVIDEKNQKPWHPDLSHYRATWRPIAREAAKTCPILEGFQDQHLRKVAMTWMHAGGATDSEAAAVSGHSDASMAQMKRHYVHKNAQLADRGLEKMARYIKTRGGFRLGQDIAQRQQEGDMEPPLHKPALLFNGECRGGPCQPNHMGSFPWTGEGF